MKLFIITLPNFHHVINENLKSAADYNIYGRKTYIFMFSVAKQQ